MQTFKRGRMHGGPGEGNAPDPVIDEEVDNVLEMEDESMLVKELKACLEDLAFLQKEADRLDCVIKVKIKEEGTSRTNVETIQRMEFERCEKTSHYY